jgi:hypothetical protein
MNQDLIDVLIDYVLLCVQYITSGVSDFEPYTKPIWIKTSVGTVDTDKL